MGLGKTVQALAAAEIMARLYGVERVLIVCPTSLKHQWRSEIDRFTSRPTRVIEGLKPRRIGAFADPAPFIKITNYDTVHADLDSIGGWGPDLVILDEAQRIKNRESKTAQAARCLRRSRSWALTGTPIENKPDDLVNLFAFIDPDRIPPDAPADELPALTADCILRRVKEDVAKDMPPKVVQDVALDLTPAQRESYTLAETEGVIRLNGLGDTVTVQHVFELVMRLKQICNFDPLTGESAKLEQLAADIAEVAESGRKAIVFSQWVGPLEKMAVALAPFGAMLYHGKVPQRERVPILDRFKTDPDKHVLLMSYGTGSVGLNLQFTNYVFLFDRWWNPAVEDQAINRAHRLGQTETVFVKRFVTQETIEGRIADVLERKRRLFDELISRNGPPAQLGLSEEEIFGLFDIKSRPRRLAAG
jgi:SNF2 family DNA or RNA helicase